MSFHWFRCLNRAVFHISSYGVLVLLMRILFPSTPKPEPLFAWLTSSFPLGRESLNPLLKPSLHSQTRSASPSFHQPCHHLFSITLPDNMLSWGQSPSLPGSLSYTQCLAWGGYQAPIQRGLNKYVQIHVPTNHFVTFDLIYFVTFWFNVLHSCFMLFLLFTLKLHNILLGISTSVK